MANSKAVSHETEPTPVAGPFKRLQEALRSGAIQAGKALRRRTNAPEQSGLSWDEMARLGSSLSRTPRFRRSR
ncbi:MAG: hypothetical protein ACT4O1_01855 [Gemmatimonadota bacterium]